MPFIHSYKTFFSFFSFRNIIMHILNIASAIKMMTVNENRDLIYENYYKQIGFSKGDSYLSMIHQKKKIKICLQLN